MGGNKDGRTEGGEQLGWNGEETGCACPQERKLKVGPGKISQEEQEPLCGQRRFRNSGKTRESPVRKRLPCGWLTQDQSQHLGGPRALLGWIPELTDKSQPCAP